jgi:putative FmdB family regulatory protein
MPTYQYECKKCGHKFENMKPISKRDESVCPKCGNTDNTRFIGTGAGFILRGEGFYENDYKKASELYQPMDKEDD